ALDGRAQVVARGVELRRRAALADPAVRVDLVADFGGDHHALARAAERLPQQPLYAPAAILVGGVVERDATLDRVAQQPQRLVLGNVPPPPPAELPRSHADLGYGQVRRS